MTCTYCGHDPAMHTPHCVYDGAPGFGSLRDCTCTSYRDEPVVVPIVEVVVETGPIPVIPRMDVGWGG